MAKLVEQLGIKQVSTSPVSDVQVEAFRGRPLDAGPHTFVRVDALVVKVREAGRTIDVHALVAVGVNADGGGEVWVWRSPATRTARAGRRSCDRWPPHAPRRRT